MGKLNVPIAASPSDADQARLREEGGLSAATGTERRQRSQKFGLVNLADRLRSPEKSSVVKTQIAAFVAPGLLVCSLHVHFSRQIIIPSLE
jgi:hypothetical protein